VNLRDSAYLADENINSEVSRYLESLGINVLEVKGTDDQTLLDLANKESKIILTHDADFGTMAIAAGSPVFGIVFLRPGHISPEFTIGSLRTLFDQAPEVSSPFLIVVKRSGDSVAIRIRTL
jgi:predicted nuclease of predicted toxin-antitoxin system